MKIVPNLVWYYIPIGSFYHLVIEERTRNCNWYLVLHIRIRDRLHVLKKGQDRTITSLLVL